MDIAKNIIIISGPSGAGEDSIIDGLKAKVKIERVVTTTTRLMRPGESQGNPYYFVSQEDFQALIEKDALVEYAKEYNGQWYGVTKDELERVARSGRVGIWKIEYKGVMNMKKKFPGIQAIYIIAPLDQLESRIRRRDKVSDEYINERMEYTREWMKHEDIYDYKIENSDGHLNHSINQIGEIIKKVFKE